MSTTPEEEAKDLKPIGDTIAKLKKLCPNVQEAAFEKIKKKYGVAIDDKQEKEILDDFFCRVFADRFLLRSKREVKNGFVLNSIWPNTEPNMKCPNERHFQFIEGLVEKMISGAKLEGVSTPYSNNVKTERIGQIDYVENDVLEAKFIAKKEDFMKRGIDTNELHFFHGTKDGNIESIMRDNFDLQKSVRFAHGKGIYFSEFPDVSLGYGEALLLCRALPGRIQTQPGRLDPSQFDSLRVHPVAAYNPQSQEPVKTKSYIHVIADPDQILPFCRIHFGESAMAPAKATVNPTFAQQPKLQVELRPRCPGCNKRWAMKGHTLCDDCQQMSNAIVQGILSPPQMSCINEDFGCDKAGNADRCDACRALNIDALGFFEDIGDVEFEVVALKCKAERVRKEKQNLN